MRLEIVRLGETFNLASGRIVHHVEVEVDNITGQTMDLEVSEESYQTLKAVADALLAEERHNIEVGLAPPPTARKLYEQQTQPEEPLPPRKISMSEALSGTFGEAQPPGSSPFQGVEAPPQGNEVILTGLGQIPG